MLYGLLSSAGVRNGVQVRGGQCQDRMYEVLILRELAWSRVN